MTSPTTVKTIRAYLNEAPQEATQRFESLLVAAQSGDDIAQVQRLTQAAKPLLVDNPQLQQWHTYALGYLALVARQQPAEAVASLESLRAQKERLAPRLWDRVLNGLGLIYEMNEQWDRALRCYQECIELCEAKGDDLGLGKALYNLAIVHYKGLDYEAAEACTKRSIALLNQKPDDKSWQTNLGNAWNELGMIQMKLGHLDEAREALKQSLAIDVHWNNLQGQGISYTNLAHIYRLLGDRQKAKAYYLRARDILQPIGYQREMAEISHGLGLLNLQAEDTALLDQAGLLFTEALELAQTANNHEITTEIFLSRATLQTLKGNPRAALAENRRAVETVESLRANIVLPEDRTRMQGSRIEAYEQMVARLCQSRSASDHAEAFYYAEMAKSRALIEILAGRPIRQPENVPVEWLEQEAQLRQSLHRLFQDYAANQDRIAPLEAELAQLRQRIQLQDAEFESFHTVAPLSLAEVMARLPEGGVLVEYFTAGDTILAFVVTPTNGITVTHLPLPLKSLQRFTQTTDDNPGQLLRQLTRGQNYRLRQPWILEKLSQTLLEPLGEIIWSAPLLCIVPHGPLHYIPFHALYQKTKAGPRYLLGNNTEPRQIIYAPSATTLFDYCQHKAPSSQTGCLAIGYNDLALPVPLTQAEVEATAIAQITGGQSRTGTAATRALLFEESANYRYLHFSCHGRFNPTWPMASSLSLADGSLDVADILHRLRLNADLVTLSACETGRSHVLQGDELVGLFRAFLYAGTPSVLVSHWVVDDLSTRLLMERFYRELISPPAQLEIGAKAKALAKAQNFIRNLTLEQLKETLLNGQNSTAKIEQQLQYLAVSAGYDSLDNLRGDECLLAHPYYWASFFLVGERLQTSPKT